MEIQEQKEEIVNITIELSKKEYMNILSCIDTTIRNVGIANGSSFSAGNVGTLAQLADKIIKQLSPQITK